MKYCPVCHESYADETLNFCLEDGSHLLTEEFISNSPTIAFRTSSNAPNSLRSFSSETPSIAILPFVNVSADPDNEYFCDGLAEELINTLMKLDKLRVAARTSAFAFKGRESDVRYIGQNLNVETILEGSVRKSGDHLRITAQLINVADGYQVWSERYDRELSDIFAIQDEITLAIVDVLKVKLLNNEKAILRKRYTDNAEAYQLYLKGRLWNRRTADGFKSAIGYFQKAIELDDGYAIAHAGLADYYTVLAFYEGLPPGVARDKAKAFAAKAIELDNTIGETHSSYGVTQGAFDWKWTEARKAYRRAIEINPYYMPAYQYLAMNLLIQNKPDEAIENAEHCLEIDPLLPVINANLAWFYYLSRKYDKAEEQARMTIDIEPNHFTAHWVLGLALAAKEKYAESLASLQNAATISSNRPFVVAELARVNAVAGNESDARNALKFFDEAEAENYISPVNRAKVHLGLGEIDAMFESLEKGFAERSVRMPYFMIDPQCDGIQADERFISILQRAGIEHRN
ncbi:MAG: tetratricopeptide repeat protein [Acidobacteriota bacterium]